MSKRRTAFVVAVALGGATAFTAAASEMVKYEIDRTNHSIPASLTGKPGDAENGKKVAIDRRKGNCLACHAMPIPEQPFHGRIAPPLVGVGARYDAAQLRLRIVDPKALNPMTIMPSFYKTEGMHRVLKKFQGKTILSAQEVEDVIAYLQTLK